MNDQTSSQSVDIGEDLMVGETEIAEGMGWKISRVRHLRFKGFPLIHKTPGMGIWARKSTLLAYFAGEDARALAELDQQQKTA